MRWTPLLPSNASGITPALLIALLGSILLHAGVLLWGPRASSAKAHQAYAIEARLAEEPSPSAPAPATPPTPYAPRPEKAAMRSIMPDATPAPKPLVPQETAPATPPPTPATPATPPAATPATTDTAPSDAVYFSSGQLDEAPRLLGVVQRNYPARARNAGIEGYVVLSLLINEHGGVDDIHVVRAQPEGFFEEAAIAMLRGHRFTPGLKEGRPVKSVWQQTIRFRLQD